MFEFAFAFEFEFEFASKLEFKKKLFILRVVGTLKFPNGPFRRSHAFPRVPVRKIHPNGLKTVNKHLLIKRNFRENSVQTSDCRACRDMTRANIQWLDPNYTLSETSFCLGPLVERHCNQLGEI